MTCAAAAIPDKHLRHAEALKTDSGACAAELRGAFSLRAEAPSTDTLRSRAPQLAVPKGARGYAGTPAETTSSPNSRQQTCLPRQAHFICLLWAEKLSFA